MMDQIGTQHGRSHGVVRIGVTEADYHVLLCVTRGRIDPQVNCG